MRGNYSLLISFRKFVRLLLSEDVTDSRTRQDFQGPTAHPNLKEEK